MSVPKRQKLRLPKYVKVNGTGETFWVEVKGIHYSDNGYNRIVGIIANDIYETKCDAIFDEYLNMLIDKEFRLKLGDKVGIREDKIIDVKY